MAWHRVAAPPAATRDPFLYDTPQRFDSQLRALAQVGLQPTNLSEVRTAQGSLSGKVVVTFDDGCANVLANGLPALARHKFTAIQFLVAGMLGGQNDWDVRKGDIPERLMTAEEVRQWLGAGMEIGSHSMTHGNLRHMSAAEAREEIIGSKKSLEDRFGVEIRHFCYPYGSQNDQVRDLAGEAGYETACTMDFGVNDSSTPALALKRIIPLSSAALLLKVLHRLSRKLKAR